MRSDSVESAFRAVALIAMFGLCLFVIKCSNDSDRERAYLEGFFAARDGFSDGTLPQSYPKFLRYEWLRGWKDGKQ